jgi:hypothetical protein
VFDRNPRTGNTKLRESYIYRSVLSGFYVTARVNGDYVRLELMQQKENIGSGNTINTSSLSTTVNGTLGEWITIGSVSSGSRNTTRELDARSAAVTDIYDNIEIKVIKID